MSNFFWLDLFKNIVYLEGEPMLAQGLYGGQRIAYKSGPQAIRLGSRKCHNSLSCLADLLLCLLLLNFMAHWLMLTIQLSYFYDGIL